MEITSHYFLFQKIDDNTDIIYQASHKHGQVQARDFVILRHRYDRDCYFISAGISITSKFVPSRSNYIRYEILHNTIQTLFIEF